MEDKAQRLQIHLALIRSCAGWSAATLGKKLGVTRQMVSNIENGRPLTKIQYLAIRKVFDDEILNSPEDTVMLRDVINVLVDEPGNYSIEDRNKVLSDANLLSPAIMAKKSSRKNASRAWMATFAGVAIAAVGIRMKSLLDDKK